VVDRVEGGISHARETADQGRRGLHDRQDQARDLAREAQQKVATVADQTRESVARLIEEQPILMAALGAALGAAIGAAVPLSRQEKELLGAVGASAVGAGRDALAGATAVLREEADRPGLAEKVGELADKVVQGAKLEGRPTAQ
jgi:hypothetical protein